MKKLLLSCVILLTSINFLSAQQRPKVGLVLSGGGAKGIAHIGVLKAIDSAGLKIDYITGTSMGSIIGGLYSVGYSGNQIEQVTSMKGELFWEGQVITATNITVETITLVEMVSLLVNLPNVR